MSLIETTNLTKTYGTGDSAVTVLKGLSFQITEGEFVAIIGPSGSGKSTLMHILGGLDQPTSGEYRLNNVAVSSLTDDALADIRNRQIGFVFQAFNLLPRTSALDNVALPQLYAGAKESVARQKATELLKNVGLADRMDHTAAKLSGGQQQRVAIARSLVMNPALLLADEPTGNLASHQGDEIMAIFEQLHTDGHTIVMITHEPDIAAHAKRVIELKDGVIVSDRYNAKRRA